MRTAALALVLVASSVAAASAAPPGLTEPTDREVREEREEPPPAMELPAPPPLAEKSPQLAAALSIGATSIGYAMLLGSRGDNQNVAEAGALLAFLGPSTGQWYSGKVGALGIGARSLALGVAFYAIVTGM